MYNGIVIKKLYTMIKNTTLKYFNTYITRRLTFAFSWLIFDNISSFSMATETTKATITALTTAMTGEN